MPIIEGGVTLKYGTGAKIARKHGLSGEHVMGVVKGLRPGSSKLVRDIRETARRQSKSKEAKKVA